MNNESKNQKVGVLCFDKSGRPFREINGKNIYQIDEKTEADRKMNEAINSWRASGLSTHDWLMSK